ncbi:MAG TPA: hypothetical protein VFC07_14415 [Verrucomicrobiae bacterium]|nr:hypothetical protein [Verrucomicrobiae bacterium]
MEYIVTKEKPRFCRVPLWLGLVSIALSGIYSSQRAGMQPHAMAVFVQHHLDFFAGTAEILAICGFVLLLVLAKRCQGLKSFKMGILAITAAVLWSFIFQSL